MSEDVVYYSARGAGGSGDVFHVDPDCRMLSRARKVHSTSRDQLADWRRECAICGDSEDDRSESGQDRSHYEALKSAASSDGGESA